MVLTVDELDVSCHLKLTLHSAKELHAIYPSILQSLLSQCIPSSSYGIIWGITTINANEAINPCSQF